jgi:hypothetical protein
MPLIADSNLVNPTFCLFNPLFCIYCFDVPPVIYALQGIFH